MSEPQVLTEFGSAVATITLNRPAALIRGAGDNFMAGGDLKSFHKSLTEDRDGYIRRREMHVVAAHQLIYQLRRMPKPVLASVRGAVAGFGLSLVLAADLAIASNDAMFTLAYRHVGLSADGGATYFLPRVVGERRALELALLGERFTAERAQEIGIVNWIASRAKLDEETASLARRLADGPTVALGLVKRLIRASLDNSRDEQSHPEAESFALAAATADHLEGVSASVDKRKAVFRGV
jgi:2-(1,2-epoxy-1,2-dihydrophenyl)acetyl-CoA isomerase